MPKPQSTRPFLQMPPAETRGTGEAPPKGLAEMTGTEGGAEEAAATEPPVAAAMSALSRSVAAKPALSVDAEAPPMSTSRPRPPLDPCLGLYRARALVRPAVYARPLLYSLDTRAH